LPHQQNQMKPWLLGEDWPLIAPIGGNVNYNLPLFCACWLEIEWHTDEHDTFETKFGVKNLKIDKLPISGFLPRGYEGVGSPCPAIIIKNLVKSSKWWFVMSQLDALKQEWPPWVRNTRQPPLSGQDIGPQRSSLCHMENSFFLRHLLWTFKKASVLHCMSTTIHIDAILLRTRFWIESQLQTDSQVVRIQITAHQVSVCVFSIWAPSLVPFLGFIFLRFACDNNSESSACTSSL
jgi:hypothetical protein